MSNDSGPYGQMPLGNDAPQQQTPIDYFGFQATERFPLDSRDPSQYFELQVLNEGLKLKFQKATSRDLIMEKNSGNARMKMDAGSERHELIRVATVNWSIYREGQPQQFTLRNLNDFLTLANPAVVERIEKRIREMNPWLLGDMTVEAIDEEIERLTELRREVEARESGKDYSSAR